MRRLAPARYVQRGSYVYTGVAMFRGAGAAPLSRFRDAENGK